MVDAVLVILLGVAAGAVAGLFGVGGGIVFVPTLTLVLGLTQLEAEATSLLAIIPVALLGSWRQTRAGQVRWRDATIIGPALGRHRDRGRLHRRRGARAGAPDRVRHPAVGDRGPARAAGARRRPSSPGEPPLRVG